MAYEPLLLVDKIKFEIERLPDRKLSVRSSSWDEKKVIFFDEVLEVRVLHDGRIRVARKDKPHDPTDLPLAPMPPIGRARQRLRTTFAPVSEGDRTPFAPSRPEGTS
jgi:hypothetical protein